MCSLGEVDGVVARHEVWFGCAIAFGSVSCHFDSSGVPVEKSRSICARTRLGRVKCECSCEQFEHYGGFEASQATPGFVS